MPRVIEAGCDESGSWLPTAALPVQGFPFEWSAGDRPQAFEPRVAAGEGPENRSGDHAHLGIAEARELLSAPPLPLDLVVCHGGACAPNTVPDGPGNFSAHVDPGEPGVADRWSDLAIAAWSTAWNHGPGYEDCVHAGSGIEPDATRIGYYGMPWDPSQPGCLGVAPQLLRARFATRHGPSTGRDSPRHVGSRPVSRVNSRSDPGAGAG